MLDKAIAEGEHVFTRRSALQVKTGTLRIGGVIAGTTDSLVIPVGATLIEISSTVQCYINFGASGVTAALTIGNQDTASRLFQAGVQIFEVPLAAGVLATHMAFIDDGTGGVIQVEKLA